MRVQKEAKEAARRTGSFIAARSQKMDDVYYNLEVEKGQWHEEWEDLPAGSFVYS